MALYFLSTDERADVLRRINEHQFKTSAGSKFAFRFVSAFQDISVFTGDGLATLLSEMDEEFDKAGMPKMEI